MARPMIRLKYLCSSFSTPITQDNLKSEGNYPVYGASGLVGYQDEFACKKDYLGIIKDGAGVGRIMRYKGESSLLGTMAYIIPTEKVDINWLNYAIQSLELGKDILSTTIPHIYFKDYSKKYLAFSPLSEQQRIAKYLDTQCTEIDRVLEKTRASIEDYKKLKQAVITQAVTKGVRGARPMKDSGIEWIGDIPQDWDVVKVRNIGTPQNGISKGGEYFGEGYPFVSYGDVYKNMVLPQTVVGLIRSTPEEQERYSVKAGDIFFTRTSETIEEVGFSSVCEYDIPNATFAGFLIRVRPTSNILSTGYSKYYFRSTHLRFFLAKEMNLVTRASLGQSLLKSMPVLAPNLDEQAEIAEYLDAKCTAIDTLIDKKQQFLTELESYKKSLIYECVTGKREIPPQSPNGDSSPKGAF